MAAIKAFFKFIEYQIPSSLDQSHRIQAIPSKKVDEILVDFLNKKEVHALVNAPDPKTYSGTRDRAMIYLAISTGPRVSELIGLKINQVNLSTSQSIRILGKGRRETVKVIKVWLNATKKVPSIGEKRVGPHVLRHTCAMQTLQATKDVRRVA